MSFHSLVLPTPPPPRHPFGAGGGAGEAVNTKVQLTICAVKVSAGRQRRPGFWFSITCGCGVSMGTLQNCLGIGWTLSRSLREANTKTNKTLPRTYLAFSSNSHAVHGRLAGRDRLHSSRQKMVGGCHLCKVAILSWLTAPCMIPGTELRIHNRVFTGNVEANAPTNKRTYARACAE